MSARWRWDEPVRRARLAELGPEAVDPRGLLLYSARQYRERGAWNARHRGRNAVPPPFDAEAAIDWVPAQALRDGSVRWVPAACCCFARPRATEAEAALPVDSNGCASGPTPAHAVRSAFLELVERDGVAIWWYNRARRPGIALDTVAELRPLVAWLAGQGRSLHALDLTTDLGVPVAAAVSARTDGSRIVFGFAAHFSRRRALVAAATELMQVLHSARLMSAHRAGSPAEGPPPDPEGQQFLAWLDNARLLEHPHLQPADGPALDADSAPLGDGADDDLAAIRSLCEVHGLDPCVIDLTRTDIGVPAVRVVAPGLRPWWARFAPGRLYDVPVRLGWRRDPIAESDLNPLPMFL